MSKKDLIKKYKSGEVWENKNGRLICWDVSRLIKRYLSRHTCKLTSREKALLKEEADNALSNYSEIPKS